MGKGAEWGPRLFSSLFKVDPSSALHPFIHLRSVVSPADRRWFSKFLYVPSIFRRLTRFHEFSNSFDLDFSGFNFHFLQFPILLEILKKKN